jgi:hypothetical protein
MTNPKQIRIFKISMTKPLWPICKLNRFEDLDIGILDLFDAWCLGFGIYGFRIKLRPMQSLLGSKLVWSRHDKVVALVLS